MLQAKIMKVILGLCVLLNSLHYIHPYVFPSVERCSFADYKCLKKSFQKALPLFADGIPELGIERLDELVLKDKVYKLSGLDFTLKDALLKGLKTIVFDHVSFDTNKNILFTDYHVEKCSLKGKYEGVGNIKVLPLSGAGEIFLKFRNIVMSVNSTFVLEKRNNNEYLIPQKYTFNYEVKDSAHFNMTNLFAGNKELSNAVLTFLNANWREVSKEFGKPIIEHQTKQIFKNVVKYFSNSPLNEIFLI